MNEEHDEIIVLKQFHDSIEANIAKTKLDAFGIPCFLSGENMAGLYPGQQVAPFPIRLHVFERDREQAFQILADNMNVH